MNYYFVNQNLSYDSLLSYNNLISPYFYSIYGSYIIQGKYYANQTDFNFQYLYAPNQQTNQSLFKKFDVHEEKNENSEEKSSELGKNLNNLSNNLRNRNIQKQLKSAKKNCESNLVNQFLSYFSSFHYSSALIIRVLKKIKLKRAFVDEKDYEKATLFFCKQISIINRRKERKYVNKKELINHFTVQRLQRYMPDILDKVQRFQILTKEQFCELFRRSCFNFFRIVSVTSVTSSAKLHSISRPEHIRRRRLIMQVLSKK